MIKKIINIVILTLIILFFTLLSIKIFQNEFKNYYENKITNTIIQ